MASIQYRVTATALNVRIAPSMAAEVIASLSRETVVWCDATSADGYWAKMTHGLTAGWVSRKYLTVVTAPARDEFLWMPVARHEEGTTEYAGAADNPRIIQYLRSTTLDTSDAANDETPWCSAFVNWCVERAGYAGTDSAVARSWLTWGARADAPTPGCIVVLRRAGNKGHVGFYVGENTTHVRVLGGNQSNAVCVSEYAKADVLGYRVPL